MTAERDLDHLDQILCSYLSAHDGDCCRDARVLLLGRFTASGDAGAAVAAVAAEFHWAPSHWPVWWCDLDPDDPHADCGVIAAVASSVLAHFGIDHVRGRAAIEPAPAVPAHWSATWHDAGANEAWIQPSVVHHEVLGIGTRWWDPTEGSWFAGPGATLLAGTVIGVRPEGEPWILLDRSDAAG